jgi:hypothetical protein
MKYRWEQTDRKGTQAGVRSLGLSGHVSEFLAIVFALLGIIADAANATLGLEATTWLLLALVAFGASITSFIAWAVCWHLTAIEARSEKKE